MSFEFFYQWLPRQQKLSCYFHKKIYVISAIILIILSKMSFLAQTVNVSEIYGFFSQIYPTY